MPDSESENFDDPGLKTAIRRALPPEQTPVALRNRVEEIFIPGRNARGSSGWQLRRSWRNLAVAAGLLLCIGLAAWYCRDTGRVAPEAVATAALPVGFAQDLVTTHDHCASLPDHHILKGVPDDDFRLMTQKLRDQLGFPALAAAAGDGWIFDGASASCKVGHARSAHLVFKQNGESLSLFSVAVASETWPDGHRPREGEHFTNTQAGHPIVSWVHDDTVFSVVGASVNNSLDLRGITPVADRIRVAVSGDDLPAEIRTTVAAR